MSALSPCIPAAALAAAILTGCGGSTPAPADQSTRVELLASSERGMQSVSFDARNAYVSLANNKSVATAVVRAAMPLDTVASWSEVAMNGCALAPVAAGSVARAAQLKTLGGKTWLFQPSDTVAADKLPERALCELNAAGTSFMPKDQGLKACHGTDCNTLWMSELHGLGKRLYSNAGAGPNLMYSDDQGLKWHMILGQFDAMFCTLDQAFHIIGSRLLVGGECPLDIAYLRAYQLDADGSKLASGVALPVSMPEIENRNIEFITSVPGTERVFAGVEGGLLRSEDGGASFKFVIREPIEGGTRYPYIGHFVALKNRPNVLVVSGYDKATGKPYLAWSDNSGDKWTDVSMLLPGYQRGSSDEATTQVTSMIEGQNGRILMTVNQDLNVRGKLLQLTLGASPGM
jgi:hypothetical protein